MKDGQLFRVKVIKTDTDLPKEDGSYFICYRDKIHDVYNWKSGYERAWEGVSWYLEPIEEQEPSKVITTCNNPITSEDTCNVLAKKKTCIGCKYVTISKSEEPSKGAEEIPQEIVFKMQREFEPNPDSTFKQGMYSGYAFGLQDGFKYAMEQYRAEGAREELYNDLGEWTKEVFPDADSIAHLYKLKDETEEAIKTPTDITEYADCLMAIFGASYKAGFAYDELILACKNKLSINKTRKWIKGKNNTYQHI
jgi:hypothetical protein